MFPALGPLVGFSQGTALKTELRAGGEQGQGIYFPSSFPAGLWVHLGRVPASVQGLLLYLQLSLSPPHSLIPWGLNMVMIPLCSQHKGGHGTLLHWVHDRDRFPPLFSLFPTHPVLLKQPVLLIFYVGTHNIKESTDSYFLYLFKLQHVIYLVLHHGLCVCMYKKIFQSSIFSSRQSFPLLLFHGSIIFPLMGFQSSFSQFPLKRHLGCFQLFAITNVAIRNNLVDGLILLLLYIRKMKQKDTKSLVWGQLWAEPMSLLSPVSRMRLESPAHGICIFPSVSSATHTVSYTFQLFLNFYAYAFIPRRAVPRTDSGVAMLGNVSCFNLSWQCDVGHVTQHLRVPGFPFIKRFLPHGVGKSIGAWSSAPHIERAGINPLTSGVMTIPLSCFHVSVQV